MRMGKGHGSWDLRSDRAKVAKLQEAMAAVDELVEKAKCRQHPGSSGHEGRHDRNGGFTG